MIATGATFYLVAGLAALLVGASKGGLPGVGMLAVPIMSLVIPPITAAGLLLPLFVVTDMFGVMAYHRHFSPRNLLILIPAATFGVGIGWGIASAVPEAALTLLVGLIGLGFVLQRWLRRGFGAPRPARWGPGLFWGALAGLTSFIAHAGAPPFQIYVLPQRMEKMPFIGTSTILFAIVNAEKLLPYWALGQLSFRTLHVSALLFPPGIAATLLTFRLVKRIPDRLFFTGVDAVLFLVSLKLTWSALASLAGP